jgi:hypothetical protein
VIKKWWNSVTASVESVVPSQCWNSSASSGYLTSGGKVNGHTGSCVTSSGAAQQTYSAMFHAHEVAVCDTEIDCKMKRKTNRRTNISSDVVLVFSDAVNKDN